MKQTFPYTDKYELHKDILAVGLEILDIKHNVDVWPYVATVWFKQ